MFSGRSSREQRSGKSGRAEPDDDQETPRSNPLDRCSNVVLGSVLEKLSRHARRAGHLRGFVMWGFRMSLLRAVEGKDPEAAASCAEAKGRSPQRILESLGILRTPVRMLFESHDAALTGVVQEVSQDCTWVRADQRPPSDLAVFGAVVFSFWNEGAAYAVTTIVVGEERTEAAWRVALQSPKELPRFECRSAFRVPVLSHPIVLKWGTLRVNGHLTDISYGGCCLSLPPGIEPPPVGMQVAVDLEARAGLMISGSVRGAESRKLRIIFEDTRQGSQILPPEALVRFVDGLQRAWIASGVKRTS